MSRVLVLFMDGVGLGADDPERNPLSAADMPTLTELLEGRKLVAGSAPFIGERASLISLDASLGVAGAPQSATGQAVLLTGANVPHKIGRHYGPKPNEEVAEFIRRDNLFCRMVKAGRTAALLNAYPPQYFENINSGHRLYSAIPMAVDAAGIKLMTAADLQAGRALSADFTGAGWSAQPSFPPTAVYDNEEAGRLLAALAGRYDMSWFDYWASDYAGHKQALERAIGLMESFDAVLGGLLAMPADGPDLIVLTSDHGNMEDMSVRGHTLNPVPALLIGAAQLRESAASGLHDLADVAPMIERAVLGPNPPGPAGS
jgi:2,3-bisphosphoglycerate-independent phosphoglycerate mutase